MKRLFVHSASISLLILLWVTSLVGQGQRVVEIRGREFVEKNGSWFAREGTREYPVKSRSLTIKFKSGVSEEQQMEFIRNLGARVKRKNRLGSIA